MKLIALSGTAVTENGVDQLRRASPTCEVEWQPVAEEYFFLLHRVAIHRRQRPLGSLAVGRPRIGGMIVRMRCS
ncbi:MAG TPA: hypothetical protein VG826_32830 [Pirellulales bacterium]|nr:hypothetical protein [Pirellulales bacterium]